MPVSESNCVRKQPRRYSYKSNGVCSDQVQDTGLVSGTMHCGKNGPRTMDPTQAATHNDRTPRNMVNGHVKNGFKSKSHETLSVSRKESKKTIYCSSAKQSECNCSVLVNGSRGLGRGPLSSTIATQEPATLDQSTAIKALRKKKKPLYKKRNNHVAPLENTIPNLTEDWEHEIQEVKLSNWEELSFGTHPYGPEDVITFTLRDLSLERTILPLWQVASSKYNPAMYHKQPINWFRRIPLRPANSKNKSPIVAICRRNNA
ncbi:uncharacterized protein LOC129410423 [Boleophthalmus pectinirostris]|uniref:uncharacterized protein LOC129410423 n=1 Tax=Boleophthalmus pectinirostris TaxID=150288 RepID=UPI0024305C0F|nr:uncharacterized protein LOC129410423 [Boleophthalmus pectinirostris]